MQKHVVSQNYSAYTAEDHGTWNTLSKRQEPLRKKGVSREYLSGFERLQLDPEKIIDMDKTSEHLAQTSGWTLIPVTGLIPTRDFFFMLINKQYPVTVLIRKPHEIDFSEQPDIFHDVYGHLPLLTSEKFVKFLTAYSIIALKYVNNERAIEYLGRLYWYTYEMGIIREDGMLKPYGGAIITSAEEIANVESDIIPKHAFDVEHIFRTPYNPYKLQKEYFVIDSFDDLFNSLETLESKLIANLLLPETEPVLHNFPVNEQLEEAFTDVISFLNDAQYRFPNAISFVAGQPDESFFEVEKMIGQVDAYVDHLVKTTGADRDKVMNGIGQYQRTKGIVNDIVSEYLRRDENIQIKGDHILMTAGAQEAFSIIISTLCNKNNDLILAEDSSYIGWSSCAKIMDCAIEGVPVNEEGIDLLALKAKIIEANRTGKRVKLLYVIPDYQNPGGACLPIGSRLKLLELAQKYNFLIVEDSAYTNFTYADKRIPTLKSLDKFNRVIYVGSFSKTLFPGLRLGFIAADQQVESHTGETIALIDHLVKVKSMLSVNTSSISQAILGGILVSNQYSLGEWNRSKFERYKQKRTEMLNALQKEFGGYAASVSWNEPQGGFFIKMTLPFAVDASDVVECARRYDVLFSPMRYFYLKGGGEKEVRLSFANVDIGQIQAGVKRLAEYVHDRLAAVKNPAREAVLDLAV